MKREGHEMINALLVCNQGMSTNVMRQKIEEEAARRGVELTISAAGVNALDRYISTLDVVLLAPQIRYTEPTVRALLDKTRPEVKLINIPPADYGMMRGDHVFDEMIAAVGGGE